MIEVESFELRRYLPMPYEAALSPRLLRVQGRAESAAGWLETRPELLEAAGSRLRAGSGALISVGDGGPAARAVAGRLCTGGDFRLLFPAPDSNGLREALALTDGIPVSVFVSGPLRDPGTAAFLRLLLDALSCRNPEAPACPVAAAAVEGTPLMNLARSQGWEILPVPAAGRFDALTAAGLLPAAAAGADVKALLQGAAGMLERCRDTSFENPAWRYAALRYELYRRGWTVEVLSSRDPCLSGVLDWWQALFAGCEGKDGKGLFPAVAKSGAYGLGQYLQEGRRMMFETALRFGGPLEAPYRRRPDSQTPPPENELDFLREQSEEALLSAHSRAGVPCLRITADFSRSARRGLDAETRTAGQICAGTGTVRHMGAGAGTARQMSAGMETVRQMSAGMGTVRQMGAGTEAVRQMGAGTGTVRQMGAGTEAVRQMGAGMGTARQMNTGTGTVRQMGAGAGTARQMSAGTGTARQMSAGTGTARQMSAGMGTVRQMGAGTGTVSQMSKEAAALGELMCFFQFACGLSAGLLDVDPQDGGALDAYHETLSELLLRRRGPEPGRSGGQL